MKTNGLISKKPKCARAAWRVWWKDPLSWWFAPWPEQLAKWHRAAKGRK